MAVLERKTHFAALFPFHEVLNAAGTVLMARLVEHKQQTFGSVKDSSSSIKPLCLWCQLSLHTKPSLLQPNGRLGSLHLLWPKRPSEQSVAAAFCEVARFRWRKHDQEGQCIWYSWHSLVKTEVVLARLGHEKCSFCGTEPRTKKKASPMLPVCACRATVQLPGWYSVVWKCSPCSSGSLQIPLGGKLMHQKQGSSQTKGNADASQINHLQSLYWLGAEGITAVTAAAQLQ